MRVLSAIVFVLGLSTLLWFVTAKPVQVVREVQSSTGVQTLAEDELVRKWLDGVVRRIDDVSFWNACAATLAAFLMYRAWTHVSKLPVCAVNSFATIPFVAMWLALAAVLVGLYLWAVYENNGTFWWLKNPNNTDAAIAVLQFSEGFINVLLIVAASVLLPMGIYLVRAINAGLQSTPSPTPLECKALLKACGAMWGVVFAPFLSTVLAFGSWKFLKWALAFAGGPQIVERGSPWWVVVLFCIVLCLQFAAIGLYAWLKLGKHVRPKVEIWKATWYVIVSFFTALPAVFLFIVVTAEWKQAAPCNAPAIAPAPPGVQAANVV